MPTAEGYASLIDRVLTLSRMGTSEAREIETAEAYRRVLAERFGLELSAEDVAGLGLY